MNVMTLFDNLRILVVDDNRSIHDDFRKILAAPDEAAEAGSMETALFGETTGEHHAIHFEIDSAYQGHEALRMVEEARQQGRPYALGFMDVRMPPGLDGIETTAAIWKIDPEMQIILCTAYSDYSWDQMNEKIGLSDRLVILKKPFDNIEALQLATAGVARWTTLRKLRDRITELEAAKCSPSGDASNDHGLSSKALNALRDPSKGGPKVDYDIRLIVEDALATTRDEWSPVAEAETHIDPALPPVPLIPGEFRQVLLNLVLNAAHAIAHQAAAGGGKGTVTIGARREGEWVEIRVGDTGIGIPEAVRNRVYDPFFTTKARKGGGRGLALARSIVIDQHDGSLAFETSSGRGTVFIIRLPLKASTRTIPGDTGGSTL
jgi:CheY-like chemotaxis protein